MGKTLDLHGLADLATPWCLRVAVTLRAAEHIRDGRTSADDIAAAASCDADYLGRVLTHLASMGVFDVCPDGTFAINETSSKLLDPGTRIGLDLDVFGGRMAHVWDTLLCAVRTGAPAYHEYYGRRFWEDLDAHPEIRQSFDALMGPEGHGPPNPCVLVNDDWQGVASVVDVGGGTGNLLAAVLAEHPTIRGVLVDLPAAVEASAAVFEDAGVTDRAETSAQSFFDPLPEGHDLYLLNGVLNDWPGDETVQILERCADAARPSAALCGGQRRRLARCHEPATHCRVRVAGRRYELTRRVSTDRQQRRPPRCRRGPDPSGRVLRRVPTGGSKRAPEHD